MTDLKVGNLSQVAATKEQDVRPLRGSEEFVDPTAGELVSLIYATRVTPICAETNQRVYCFASLLNRGSSLE